MRVDGEWLSETESEAEAELLTVLFFLLVIFAITLTNAAGPAVPKVVAPNQFSARRAAPLLRELIGDGSSRALGSPGHDAARERLMSRFRSFGYSPVVEASFACNRYGSCGWVENIVAGRPGRASGRDGVLLTAHYDSVPAGPGASDDGTGVAAVLEIARILRTEPPKARDVVFLLSDGEEAGLLGAEAFVRSSRYAKRDFSVVNLEARGSRGNAFLFETSDRNASVIDLVGQHVRTPSASSLFYSIYQRLPNDTDFSVYKHAGWRGVNFAYLGGIASYHTRLDNLSRASLRSFQQLGQGGLAMTRAFAEADVRQGPASRGNAVFFDLGTRILVRWPEGWMLPLAAANLLGIGLLIVFAARKEQWRLRSLSIAFLFLLASLAVAGVIGAGISFLSIRILDTSWPAHPHPLILFFWLLPLLTAAQISVWSRLRVTPWLWWSAASLLWGLLSLVMAIVLPGAGYLFLVPSMLSNVSGWITARGKRPSLAPAVLSLTGAMMNFPVAWVLYDAIGLPILPVSSVLVALCVAPLPFWMSSVSSSRLRFGLVAAALIAAIGLLTGLASAPYSEQSPQRLNIQMVRERDQRRTVWQVNAEPRSLPPLVASSLKWKPERLFPWSPVRSSFAPATGNVSGDPEIRVSARQSVRRNVQLHSRRGASRLLFAIRDQRQLRGLSIEGWRFASLEPFRRGDWIIVSIRGVGRTPKLELELPAGKSFDYLLQDSSYGLPSEGLELVQARDDSFAVPSGGGDGVVVSIRGQL